MKITVNGEKKLISKTSISQSLEDLIKVLGFNPSLVVVEYNGAIMPPEKWSNQQINDGDCLEIVTIVGGGN